MARETPSSPEEERSDAMDMEDDVLQVHRGCSNFVIIKVSNP